MAARYTALGALLSTSPAKAHARLGELFARHGFSSQAVATQVGVDVVTLRRWITKLKGLGFADPRGDQRAKTGRPLGRKDSAPRAKPPRALRSLSRNPGSVKG